MIEIRNNGYISINRGDRIDVPLFINMGTEKNPIRFKLSEHPNAEVLFSITSADQTFEEGVFRKIFNPNDLNDRGDLMVRLSSAETKSLIPGRYFYQFKLRFDKTDTNKKVNTITDRLLFLVK